MELLIDKTGIPKNVQLLRFLDDDERMSPLFEITGYRPDDPDGQKQGMVFLERSRLMTILGCYLVVLTLEKGPRFDCLDSTRIRNKKVKGQKFCWKMARDL
jgi:hypothetical protein